MTFRFVSRERLRACLLGACLLFSLPPRSAAAQQALPIELTWQAPEDCPQRDDVLARARTLLGSSLPQATTVAARGEVERQGDGFELLLTIVERGTAGERRVWARQCRELAGAAAVTLVLLLTTGSAGDASTTASTSADPSGGDALAKSEAPNPATPERPPTTPTDTPAGDPGPRRWKLLLAAPSLTLGIGPLPKPTLGVGLGFGAQAGGWSVRVLGQWSAAQSIAAEAANYGADVQRGTAGLWGCRELVHGPYDLGPCLMVGATHVRATGYGPRLRPASQGETSLILGAGAIGRLRASAWLSVMLALSGQVELSRPILLLNRVGTVRQLAPLSGSVVLGPEWIF
jgi:hypothetical protein